MQLHVGVFHREVQLAHGAQHLCRRQFRGARPRLGCRPPAPVSLANYRISFRSH